VNRRRSSAFVLTIAVLVTLALLALTPTPFFLISPGPAVDLSSRIAVEGRVPTHRHFYLTDISVRRATVLWLAAGLWPGTRIVRRDALVPRTLTEREYDRLLDAAMDDSQHVAAYVAERAAGLGVPPRRESGDMPALPGPVHFSIDDVGGSSGGLMFALAIYAELTSDRWRAPGAIAGTGTLAWDGRVGPIEGTFQKLLAAKRVGARIFLVPRENYREVAGEPGIAVVPVDSFSQALAALR
jgi:PDZ domain-containing protein